MSLLISVVHRRNRARFTSSTDINWSSIAISALAPPSTQVLARCRWQFPPYSFVANVASSSDKASNFSSPMCSLTAVVTSVWQSTRTHFCAFAALSAVPVELARLCIPTESAAGSAASVAAVPCAFSWIARSSFKTSAILHPDRQTREPVSTCRQVQTSACACHPVSLFVLSQSCATSIAADGSCDRELSPVRPRTLPRATAHKGPVATAARRQGR